MGSRRPWVTALVAWACLGGCGGGATDDAGIDAGDGHDGGVPTFVDLPGAAAFQFDDLRFSTELHSLVVPARGRGFVALVDPALYSVTTMAVAGDPASADEGDTFVYAVDRGAQRLLVLDPVALDTVAETPVGILPDYVRYAPLGHEIWVTEPSSSRLEIFVAGPGGSAPVHDAYLAVPGGPEGLALDATRPRAYTLDEVGGALVAIDTTTRSIVGTWPLGCGNAHGIPAIDETRGFVFAGCNGTAEIYAFDAATGTVRGHYALGGGQSLVAYSPLLRHAYLRGDPGTPVAILGVGADGSLTPLGTLDATPHGHCLVADENGVIWTGDADTGRLVRLVDRFPATAP